MGPDETLFRDHLESDAFLAGAARGKWRLHGGPEDIVWPNPIFWIQSARKFSPGEGVFLRFDLQNYPQQAPTSCPWNAQSNTRLDHKEWPKGGGNVSRVFNSGWNGSALYAPCDRIAMVRHETWATIHFAWWWKSSFTFVRYLEFVHNCLNPAGHEEKGA
jgi:hypothetical protein